MKVTCINVYCTAKGKPTVGYCNFNSAKAAKKNRTNDGSYVYTIQLTKSGVKIV